MLTLRGNPAAKVARERNGVRMRSLGAGIMRRIARTEVLSDDVLAAIEGTF